LGSSFAALFRILSLFLTSLVFLWIGMTSASGNFVVQGCVTLAGQPAAVHPQGGFAVEVQAAPGANRFPLVVTEANGTVTTKYVDLLVENSIPVIHRYDLNGNLESVAPQATPGSPTRTYQWDAVNRLVGITRILSLTETRKTEFLYNGEGSRVGKKEFINGVLQTNVRYLYGDTGVLQERSADGGTVLKTYTALGEIDSSTTPPTPRYFTRDHLGSVREVVAQNGTLLARYDYKPYGKRLQVSGTYEAAKGYTGHDYHVGSDLILTRYRAYDPNTGRWLSPDPIKEAGGMNLYRYVGNDPVNATDPLGLWTLGIGLTIQGGVGPGGGVSGGFYFGHDPDSGIFSGWSGGFLGSGELGIQTPGASGALFVHHSNAQTVDQLKGSGWTAGGSAGAGFVGGVEISGGLNEDCRGFPTLGSNGVHGQQVSFGLGAWAPYAPIPVEVHGGISKTGGWTWGATDGGAPPAAPPIFNKL
jgi:RHS repeat-associated protein